MVGALAEGAEAMALFPEVAGRALGDVVNVDAAGDLLALQAAALLLRLNGLELAANHNQLLVSSIGQMAWT